MFDDDLRAREGGKIKCGNAHFDALAVGDNPAIYGRFATLDGLLAYEAATKPTEDASGLLDALLSPEPALWDTAMFASDFDPSAALAATHCPRCRALGLVEIDEETFENTPRADRHQVAFMIDPSLPARCPACGLVMEWPACRD